jgi:hypothetical protein
MESLALDECSSKSSIIKNKDEAATTTTTVPAKTGYFITKKLFFVLLIAIGVVVAAAVLITYFLQLSVGGGSGTDHRHHCESLFCRDVQGWTDKCFNFSKPYAQDEQHQASDSTHSERENLIKIYLYFLY